MSPASLMAVWIRPLPPLNVGGRHQVDVSGQSVVRRSTGKSEIQHGAAALKHVEYILELLFVVVHRLELPIADQAILDPLRSLCPRRLIPGSRTLSIETSAD